MTELYGAIKLVRGYVAALVGIVIVTGGLALFHVHTNSTTVALALLLVVLVVATLFGSRPALLASFLGVWSFNFFFLPPFYTLTIAAPQNWVAFASFLITAIIAGGLSSYARRRAVESEARRQEIERLYRELQSAFEKASQTEALRQSEQLKSALLDAVTHDLRTPLTSIKASVTTLIEDANGGRADENVIALDEEGRNEFLEIINEETDRLNEFIGGIVDMARIEAGKLSTRNTLADVEGLISEAMERARTRLARHKVILDIGPSLPEVRVDAASMAEVIYTLLDNAGKYSPPGSEIRVRAGWAENGMLEVSVEDQGKGIPAGLRERVFEKFYRASENDIHSTASGLGLGLAIARGIVDSQGGRIRVEDAESPFVTRVTFQLPAGDNEQVGSER
jgi:two-component system sensor histidine kinase KdpD